MTTTPQLCRIRLDADGRKRLRASIAHWKRLATGKRHGDDDCFLASDPLCTRWMPASCATSDTDRCPVYQATEHQRCRTSPWFAAWRAYVVHGLDSPEFRRAAEAELAFLRDLLARVKEPQA